MKTRDEYAAMAENLATQANYNVNGEHADVAYGSALAAEALVYATLATVAPIELLPALAPEPYIPVALSIRLRELHENSGGDCGTCADETGGAMRWPCDTFTALDEAERQLSPEDHAAYRADGEPTASELYEMDQAAEFAHDAAAEKAGDAR